MKQPKPDSKKYTDLISEIKKGEIKIPKFQRNFVWSLDKTAQLLDSILRGYPIGTFILWETTERLNDVKNIGNFDLPSVADGDKIQYVLDGQQRITSLYAAFMGAKIKKKGERKTNDYSQIYVNLDANIDDSDEQIVVSEEPENNKFITLHGLLSAKFGELKKEYSDEEIDKIQEYKETFTGYDFSTITLRKEDIDSAIDVFTRINTGGQTLTLFQIMSAKTYDEQQNFDMEQKFQELLGHLKEVEYETVSSSVILSLISLVLKKECRKKIILQLGKQEIIDVWDNVISAIRESIDYFRSAYRIYASAILPYDSLLVPFAYFIYNNKGEPEGKQVELLKEFFWRVSLSHRYSSSTESKLAQDARRIEKILKGERPEYDDIKINIEPEELINIKFSTGNSYCKAILCLLAYQNPTDFKNSEKDVILDNSWLKIANSKNYHHFFPRAFLKKKEIGNENSIVNITLVSDSLNKKQIKDKPPSKYIRGFLEKNPKLQESIKSHLIEDIEGFGIMEDDYGTFLKKRAEAIHRELKKRIEPDIN